MSIQRSQFQHISAVDVFLELLKRRISYHTKKVQAGECAMVGVNGKLSLRLLRSKLRKREESSGVLRSNAVHPEGVLQATVIVDPADKPAPLQDVFVSQVSQVSQVSESLSTLTCASSEGSLSSGEVDSLHSQPLFLYSTAASRTSLCTNDQSVLVHPSAPAEDCDGKARKNIRGKLKKLVKRKATNENYTIPVEYHEQLKQIYVY